METAVGVFQQLKQNLLRSDEFDCVSGADYPSEYSEDYNHSGGHTGLLKKGVRLTASCDDLPHLPHLPHLAQVRDVVREETGLGGDSGFNSDPHSSLVYSDCLENYGLNGPLPDCSSLEDSQEPSQISEDKNSDFQPPPSVTSSTTRKRREKEVKQATIRQHYYPEGGWGYIVLLSAFLVNILAHGLQLSFGILLVAIQRRWASQVSPVSASAVGALSISLSLFISPLTVAVCKRKSTRITAVVGGLVLSLGCLFTSFASQFHQIIFSYGLVIGVGVSFVRDTSTLMVGQYFKRKREMMEIVMVSASGVGLCVMSHFLKNAIRDIGWRLGLQAVTGVLASTFILGTFYRSATLYHPQRRAILHLKSQKRKIKDKNKAQEDKLPFFDFSCLKSRSFQIILLSSSLISVGMFTPFLLLITDPELEREMGLAWVVGVVVTGLITVSSLLPRHSRQYLCQTAGLSSGLALLTVTSTQHWVWLAGISTGAYHYALKMFVFQKVRARNFARAWSLLQMSQSVSVLAGVSLSAYLSPASAIILAASAIILGSLCLSLLNLHRWRLRRRKLSKKLARLKAVRADEERTEDITVCPEPDIRLERRPSFPEEEDEEELLVAGVSFHDVEEGVEMCELEYEMCEEMEEGMEMVDNITSCNVVDNYLMLDEYEQNLSKEHEQPAGSGGRRLRKWSLARQGSSSEVQQRKRSLNNNLTFINTNKRMMNTIQEDDGS